jgi:hypothetical protein
MTKPVAVAETSKQAALREWNDAVDTLRRAGRDDLIARWKFDERKTGWTEIDARRREMLKGLKHE